MPAELGDDRVGVGVECLDRLVEGVGHQPLSGLLELLPLEVAEVVAGREDLTRPADDQAAGVERADGLGERVEQLVVERAAALRVRDREPGDRLARLVEHQLA